MRDSFASFGGESAPTFPTAGSDAFVLNVDDLVQVARRPIVRSLVDKLLEGWASLRPVSADVLLVGLSEAALVLGIKVLPQLMDVLVLLELVPSRCLAAAELLA